MITGNYGTMYYVKDMRKSVDFFKMHLGLKPRFESPDWTEFETPGGALCLHKGEKAVNGILILKVDDIRKTVAALKAAGVRLAQDVKEVHPGAWAADFMDVDGNLVSLYQG